MSDRKPTAADAMLAVERVRALSLDIRNRTGIAEYLRTIISDEILAALSPEEKPPRPKVSPRETELPELPGDYCED